MRGSAWRATILVAALTGCVSIPTGSRWDAVPAGTLSTRTRVLVVIPPSYARETQRRYPVLYFLHDGYGDGRTLARRGVAADALERMRDGRLPEFLIVAPDGPGSWFSDSYDGSRRFEEFLTEDLPRWVQERYRILPGRKARGITGISMGGYGAVKLALKHPDMFASVSSLSGALIPMGWEELPRYSFMARYTLERVFGRSAAQNSLDANDVWQILFPLQFREPPFSVSLRAGTEDVYGLDGVAAQYGNVLNEHGVPTTIVLEPGGHDWDYWRRAMPEILRWHGERFEYDSGR
ncbi:MAG: alpha/beta hydrolase family protein [Acidobacteriota bacterium]